MRKAKPKSFAAFIISHGRPDNIITYDTLRRHGYSGRIVIVIDNLDETAPRYFELYGTEQVVMFDKPAIAKTFDIGDNFDNYRSTSYARNAAFDIAKNLGIDYFIVLDDDYNRFSFCFDGQLNYIPAWQKSENLDRIFNAMLNFMIACPQVHSIALAQGGDFIGGSENPFSKKIAMKRKCMNSFVCATDRRFEFISRMNEDVNTYVRQGCVGKIFFTINQVSLNQAQTQSISGGMTELYKSLGTYVKSFYSVMYMPSAVKVRMMHTTNRRIHHAVSWNNATPMILSKRFKKKGKR